MIIQFKMIQPLLKRRGFLFYRKKQQSVTPQERKKSWPIKKVMPQFFSNQKAVTLQGTNVLNYSSTNV
jgi:hypothetical protein